MNSTNYGLVKVFLLKFVIIICIRLERGLSREEIVKLYKELELSVNYDVNGNLSEEIYKFDDDFNLNSH